MDACKDSTGPLAPATRNRGKTVDGRKITKESVQ